MDCMALLIDVHSNMRQPFIPPMFNRNGIGSRSGGKSKLAASPLGDRTMMIFTKGW